MENNITYIFTLRNTIKSEPRITQERIYLTPFEYKIVSSLSFLFSAEKDKGKKADKEKLKLFTTERPLQDYFTDGSRYLNFLNKWVETKEGWGNLKKK